MNTDTFGEWIKQRRKQLDLTQEILAERVGCSLSAIRKIENDERRPSRQIAELLALHLDVPPEERTLFLKTARGEGSIQRLSNASSSTPSTSLRTSDKLVAVPPALSPPSNIPAATSPFVGRKQESESLSRMLTDPRQRLITILGPGGIGKTRLAMQAAEMQLAAFNDQVYFIQLAAYNAVDSILPAIASVLNIPSSSSTDEFKTRLADYLRGRNVLFVLDNFEHLIEGAPQVSELLQKIPTLKVLVTSRERLNLQGEWTFELSGLSIPPNVNEGKAVYSALQLFELHAKRIRPDMELVGREREAAIRICQRVDGMPLAIELAAAWVNVLSCEEIATEIERGFDFLSSTLRDVPERHRSLRAVFDHSWQRLTEAEQNALSGLSIFQGGFRFGSAESVVGVERSVLSSLESKSLVRRQSDGRFDLHEVVRQYAGTHLKDETKLQDWHSEYFLKVLGESAQSHYGSHDEDRSGVLLREFGNLSAAWTHAVKQKKYAQLDFAVDSLYLVYDLHGWVQEGINLSQELIAALCLETADRQQQIYLGRALTFSGMIIFRSGDHERAHHSFEEAIKILREVGDESLLFPALVFCGIVTSVMGDLDYARGLMDEGTALAERYGHGWFTALGTFDQGYIAGQAGDLEYAYEQMQKGLALWRSINNLRYIAFALNYLSPIAIRMGLLDDAASYLDESLTLSTSINDRWGMATATGRLGMLALLDKDHKKAKPLLERSLAIATDLGARWDIAWALTHLGKVAIASNDLPEAERLLKRSIKLSLEAHAMPHAIDAALELAECFIHKNEFNDAAALILSAVVHPACTDTGKQRADELRTAIKQHVDVNSVSNDTIETVIARLI